MAFYNYLSYVKNGLVLHLDAANTASYSGTGTTWADVSGNGYDFQISASAYKNQIAGNSTVRYMDFKGSYGVAKRVVNSALSNVPLVVDNGITICVWTRILTTNGDWRTLIRGAGGDHHVIIQYNNNLLGMFDNDASTFLDSGYNVQTLPGYPIIGNVPNAVNYSTDWVMLTFQWQNTSPYFQVKLNNSSIVLGSVTNSNALWNRSFCCIGGYGAGAIAPVDGTNSQFWGDVAVFSAYNRLLTQAEINQNYDTFAPRFNGGGNATAGVSPRLVSVMPGILPIPTAAAAGATLQTDGFSGFWSYPGPNASTNLVDYPYADYTGGGFYLSYNYDQPGGATQTHVTNIDNPVNAPGIFRYYTGTTGYKYWAFNTKVPEANTYTFSYYARLSGGSTSSNVGMAQIWRDNGITDRTPTGDWNPTFTDKWKRYVITSYVTNSLDMFICHAGTMTGGITIDLCGFQLEKGSSASLFTATGASSPASGQFRYRSIFTHGYLAAGYKGSNPWRALNKTWHATDITLFCGEQLDKAGSYIDGTWSDFNGYVHHINDAQGGGGTHTGSYSLANGTARTRGTGTYSPPGSGFGFPTSTGTSNVGGWELSVARSGGPAGGVNQTGQVGYITGGGASACDKFHFPSETMFAGPDSGAAYGNSTVAHGELRGYFPLGGTKKYLTWSTDTWASWTGSSTNADGWSHILSTKWGHHYGGAGNVTTAIYKFKDSDGTDLATLSKGSRGYGEENFQMGQDWGYMLGNYDNQQNNMTTKTAYATDTITQLGAASQPKGHFGQSSGTCSSAAASVCMPNASAGF